MVAQFSVVPVTGFLLIDTLLAGQGSAFASTLAHLALPAAALGIAFSPAIMRVLRSGLLDVYHEDYIRQARLRGIGEGRILIVHALPNAILPTLTLMGVQFGFLFGGTLLVEVIYSYPGLGNLMVDAVRNADLPIIQTVGLTYCIVVLLIGMVVDALVLVLNPRLRDAMRPVRSGRVLAGAALILLVALCACSRHCWRRTIRASRTCSTSCCRRRGAPVAMRPSRSAPTASVATSSPACCSAPGWHLLVAVTAACGAALLGAVLAHIAGYFGGFVDWLIGRAVEVWMSFPPVILSLILMVGLGTGADRVVLAIVLVDWTRFCRVLRAEVLITTQRDYVTAARLSGFHTSADADTRNPAGHAAVADHTAQPGDGHRGDRRGRAVLRRPRRRGRSGRVGTDDRRRPHAALRRRHGPCWCRWRRSFSP